MAHCIRETDIQFGTEMAWHGLTRVEPILTKEVVAPATPPIISILNPSFVGPDGEAIPLEGFQVLLADLRGRMDEQAIRDYCKGGYSPLHVSKERYTVFNGEQFFSMIAEAVKDVDGAEISSFGTLDNGRVLFGSVDLGSANFLSVHGDVWKSHLNFLSSHDGRYAIQSHTSNTRQVCMNTVRLSLATAENVIKCKHTPNGVEFEVSAMVQWLQDELETMQAAAEKMAAWQEIGCTMGEAMALYLCHAAEGKEAKVSTQNMNISQASALAFARGMGNSGRTVYDVLNGYTEVHTHGEGVGRKSDKAKRWSKSEFGTAADKKTLFVDFLNRATESDETLKETVRIGKSVERLTLEAQGVSQN
jgi:hypothetical protein